MDEARWVSKYGANCIDMYRNFFLKHLAGPNVSMKKVASSRDSADTANTVHSYSKPVSYGLFSKIMEEVE
jgi:hypothetical protein